MQLLVFVRSGDTVVKSSFKTKKYKFICSDMKQVHSPIQVYIPTRKWKDSVLSVMHNAM